MKIFQLEDTIHPDKEVIIGKYRELANMISMVVWGLRGCNITTENHGYYMSKAMDSITSELSKDENIFNGNGYFDEKEGLIVQDDMPDPAYEELLSILDIETQR